jgi:hypothetical protein
VLAGDMLNSSLRPLFCDNPLPNVAEERGVATAEDPASYKSKEDRGVSSSLAFLGVSKITEDATERDGMFRDFGSASEGEGLAEVDILKLLLPSPPVASALGGTPMGKLRAFVSLIFPS